ncbi:MAG: ArsR/SmtB family transcription factor [Promethearchaeota archaeon]
MILKEDQDCDLELLNLITHPKRLKILDLLACSPLWTSEITKIIGISQPATHKHITTLKKAQIIQEIEDKNVSEIRKYYKLHDENRHLFLVGMGPKTIHLHHLSEKIPLKTLDTPKTTSQQNLQETLRSTRSKLLEIDEKIKQHEITLFRLLQEKNQLLEKTSLLLDQEDQEESLDFAERKILSLTLCGKKTLRNLAEVLEQREIKIEEYIENLVERKLVEYQDGDVFIPDSKEQDKKD